jgi:hypothetical protein
VQTVAPVMGTGPPPALYRKRYCIGAPGTVGDVAGQNPPSCRQPVKAKSGPPPKYRPEYGSPLLVLPEAAAMSE